MAHNLSNAKTFDVDGTKYLVGVDDFGFVQIQTGEVRWNEDSGEEEFVPHGVHDDIIPHIMLDPDTAPEVADYIKTLVE